jgi:8-oxo-dGTP pyrophosphatase MutT (NUDIX family)
MSTERERSYGGVVVRGGEVLVITPAGRSRVRTLPKGGANAGESQEATALREVREETGVVARVVRRLGDVEYQYRRRGVRVFKTVGFYLCDYVSGDTADHDHEVEEAQWMPLEQARGELSYPGEREMIERALSQPPGDR